MPTTLDGGTIEVNEYDISKMMRYSVKVVTKRHWRARLGLLLLHLTNWVCEIEFVIEE